MAMPQIGLEAVLDTATFIAGAREYQTAVSGMERDTDRAAGSMSSASNIIQGALSTALGIVTAKATLAASQMLNLGGAAYSLAAAAAPVEGIMEGFAVTAAQAGKSTNEWLQEMQTASMGMIDSTQLMKTANLALTGAGEELAHQFGEALPIFLEAATVAARRTGQSFDYLYNSLVTGVKRASPRLIDNTGIIIRIGEANERYARSLGKTVDQLTTQERSIAILQATVQSATEMIEQQGEITLTSGERMRQYQTYLAGVRTEIGLRLQPALGVFVDGMNALAHAVLPDVIQGFSLVGGAILRAGGIITGELSAIASEAYGWGQDLGARYAEGIASAIPYIVGAIRAIGEIITSWMQPHSPPKIAPEIDQWGRELADIYFEAFEGADLSAITGFANKMGTGLKEALSGGLLSEPEVRGMLGPLKDGFAGLVKEAAELGYVTEESLQKFERLANPIGRQAGDLAGRLLGVTAPTMASDLNPRQMKEIADAQRRFLDAVGTTDQRLEVLYDDLKNVQEGSADYYDILVDVFRLESQRDQELKSVEEAQFRYALAQADTAGKIDLYNKKLSGVEAGSAEYYDILTTIYNLEQERADQLARDAELQDRAGQMPSLDKAIDDAKRLADAELDWRLATADAAGQVAILKEELAKLEPGTAEWYRMAIRLQQAQERLNKQTSGGAGFVDEYASSLVEATEKIKPFPDLLADIFDPEKIDIKAEEIKAKILTQLEPLKDIGPALALLLQGQFKDALQAALFGAVAEPTGRFEVTPGMEGAAPGDIAGEPTVSPIKQWVPLGGDKSWEELRVELGNRIHTVVKDAIIDVFEDKLPPWATAWLGDKWEYILGAGLIINKLNIVEGLSRLMLTIVEAAILSGAIKKAVAGPTATAASLTLGEKLVGILKMAAWYTATIAGSIFTKLGSTLSKLASGAFGIVQTVLTRALWLAVSTPFLVTAGLVGGLVFLVYKAIKDEAVEVFGKKFEFDPLGNLQKTIAPFVGWWNKTLVPWFTQSKADITSWVEGITIDTSGLSTAWGAIKTALSAVISWWDTTAAPWFKRVRDAMKGIDLSGIVGAIGGAASKVGGGVKSGADWAADKLGGAGKWVDDQTAILSTFFLETVPATISGAVETFSASIASWLLPATNKLSLWISTNIWKLAQWAAITVPNTIAAAAVALSTGISTWLSTATTNLSTWVTDRATDFTTLFTTTIPTAITGASQKLVDAVNGVMGAMKAAADAAAAGIRKAIVDPLRSAYNSAIRFLNSLPEIPLVFGGFNFPEWTEEAETPGAARGKDYWSGGKILVGEEGPEIVDLPRGSRVSSTGDSRNRLEELLSGPLRSLESVARLLTVQQNEMAAAYASALQMGRHQGAPSMIYSSRDYGASPNVAVQGRQVSVTIGPNTISGEVDLAVLEARVRRVIREETRG